MAKWVYKLRNGRALRDAIHRNQIQKVLTILKDSYKELLDMGFIDDYDYERYTEDFDMYVDDDEYLMENIDYELDEFYDLCDNLGVWIPIEQVGYIMERISVYDIEAQRIEDICDKYDLTEPEVIEILLDSVIDEDEIFGSTVITV